VRKTFFKVRFWPPLVLNECENKEFYCVEENKKLILDRFDADHTVPNLTL
jgi:hypothetical protein